MKKVISRKPASAYILFDQQHASVSVHKLKKAAQVKKIVPTPCLGVLDKCSKCYWRKGKSTVHGKYFITQLVDIT